MFMSDLLTYISVHHVCIWCPWRLEEGVISTGTGLMEGYEPPCGVSS